MCSKRRFSSLFVAFRSLIKVRKTLYRSSFSSSQHASAGNRTGVARMSVPMLRHFALRALYGYNNSLFEENRRAEKREEREDKQREQEEQKKERRKQEKEAGGEDRQKREERKGGKQRRARREKTSKESKKSRQAKREARQV